MLSTSSSVFESLLEMHCGSGSGDDPDIIYIQLPSDCPRYVSDQFVVYILDGIAPSGHRTLSDLWSNIRAWERLTAFLDVSIVYPGDTSISFMDALTNFPEIKRSIELNIYRRKHVFNMRGALDQTPYALLKPVSDLIHSSSSSFIAGTPCARLQMKASAIGSPGPDVMLDCFERNVDWFKSCFPDMPWYSNRSGVILAGGFLTASLYDLSRPREILEGTDVDMFLIVNHADFHVNNADIRTMDLVQREALRIIHNVIESIESIPDKAYVSSLKEKTLTFTILKPFHMKLQIILTIYDTPTHVVSGFDIPLCKVMYAPYSGGMLTADALCAIRNNEMLFDETTMSSSGVHRYIKYMERYGTAVVIPGITQEYLEAIEKSTGTNYYRGIPGTIISLVSRLNIDKKYGQLYEWMFKNNSDYEDEDLLPILIKASKKSLAKKLKHHTFRVMADNMQTFTGAFNPIQINIYNGLTFDEEASNSA